MIIIIKNKIYQIRLNNLFNDLLNDVLMICFNDIKVFIKLVCHKLIKYYK